MTRTDYTRIVSHDQRDRAEMLDCCARHAIGMHWPVVGWTDETQPRTERPVTLFRISMDSARLDSLSGQVNDALKACIVRQPLPR